MDRVRAHLNGGLNESPSQKEGKFAELMGALEGYLASMKALPKRKGNANLDEHGDDRGDSLNESPSQKEGKSSLFASPALDTASLNESPSQKEGKSISWIVSALT